MPESRRGLFLGLGAYAIWGSFPLYFPLLKPAGAFEILAHRVLWSLVITTFLVALMRRRAQLKALVAPTRATAVLAGAATVLSVNWLTYIWAVNHDHVVESSLGYFINPLVSVVMGIVILGERLRRVQWLALSLAVLAVGVLAIDYGRLPWVALVLAFSFGTYGLAKKVADVGAAESLAFETMLIAPLAAGYVGWLSLHGRSTFAAEGPGHALLMATTGIVTAVPLLMFSAAATRLPLVTVGLLQYLAPVFQFAIGVLVFHEPMPVGRWIGFFLVWVALAVFTAEAVTHRQRQLRDAAAAVAI